MPANDARGRPGRPLNTDRQENTDRFYLQHSLIRLEEARAGVVARITRPYGIDEWAGPFDDANALRQALAEVARHG